MSSVVGTVAAAMPASAGDADHGRDVLRHPDEVGSIRGGVAERFSQVLRQLTPAGKVLPSRLPFGNLGPATEVAPAPKKGTTCPSVMALNTRS